MTIPAAGGHAAPALPEDPDNPEKPAPGSGRVASIDALRGFDMFWIVGGHGLVLTAVALFAGKVPEGLQYHMHHPAWEGFSAWDMIMPLFLFVVGAVMPFAFAKRIERGASKTSLYWKIFRRTIVLFVFGMAIQGHLLDFKLDTRLTKRCQAPNYGPPIIRCLAPFSLRR